MEILKLNYFIDTYNVAMEQYKDPLIESWFLMESLKPVSIILLLYVVFVLFIGPAVMKNREPFSLKTILIVYNAYQVIFSIWLASAPFKIPGLFNIMYNHCNIIHVEEHYLRQTYRSGYLYFFSKVVDLLDTVFFVLRKKQSQVTFLHVYHHFVMVILTWFFLRFKATEQGLFPGFLNSFVHIIMYSYYLISALGPQYQKYLWWKKYMTLLQLIQFVLMILNLARGYTLPCETPRILTDVLIFVVVMFFILFMNFYIKQYKKPSAQRNGKSSEKAAIKTKLHSKISKQK